ncbi:MAG: ATPase, T2SS/T4P/T4SS family, partial [Planctomycetales bacterium]
MQPRTLLLSVDTLFCDWELMTRGTYPDPAILSIHASTHEEQYQAFQKQLREELATQCNPEQLRRSLPEEELRREARSMIESILRSRSDLISLADRERLVEDVSDDLFGLGPLEILLRDPTISDVMINGPKEIYVERRGRKERTDVQFRGDEHVLAVLRRICDDAGQTWDESQQVILTRLADGSLVHAVLPPLSRDGPMIVVRRLARRVFAAEDLIRRNSLTSEMIRMISASVQACKNILVSGGTGGGRSTLLSIAAGYIQDDHRVVTVERAASLCLVHPHVVRLETYGKGSAEDRITSRDAVQHAQLLQPNRIILDDCQGPEAVEIVEAMNTCFNGSMTSIHAKSPTDALRRLERQILKAEPNTPRHVVRDEIASGIDLIIQTNRLSGGARKVTRIAELVGLEGDKYVVNNLFLFEETGLDAHDAVCGYFASTGN